MNRLHWLAISLTVLLSGCGEAPAAKADAEPPATLPAGLYQATAKVTHLRSTDNTTPATKLKLGDTVTTQGCVGADGKPPPSLFVAAGDVCTIKDPFVRSGRISISYDCKHGADKGHVGVGVDGHYTVDAFDAVAETDTYFVGSGDYILKLAVTGKRVGQCKG